MSWEDGSVELLGKGEVGQNSADLLGKGTIKQSGFTELLGKLEAQVTVELSGKAVIIQLGSAELFGKFDAQDIEELLGKSEIRNIGSENLYAKFDVGQGSQDLLGRADVGQDSQNLFGKFESQAVRDLLAKFEAQATAELLGKAIIRQPDSAELLGEGVIRHSDTAEFLGKEIIRHSDTAELLGNAEIRQSGSVELLGKGVVKNIGSAELPTIFWIRHPYRLWTNRRYLNGVVELTEILIGNAILEYVIEGVMQDIQSYLINASLDYSGWINIILTPKLIRRATTYGTVAALYARRAKTFATRVIPTIAPVALTVIGDEERAMNHWRDKMNQMLEFYVTSQGGDVMLTSTLDEEPVFSMEDIPPELTDFTPWHQWLMRRTQ